MLFLTLNDTYHDKVYLPISSKDLIVVEENISSSKDEGTLYSNNNEIT